MRKRTLFGIILLAFCIVCRFFTSAADFYAEKIYPVLSAGLSWLGAIFPFSLEEVVVAGFVIALVCLVVKAIRAREKFAHWLGKTLVTLMWVAVWFYMGWGNNYYRTGPYERNGIQRVSYDETVFNAFLKDFAQELNESAAKAEDYDATILEQEVKPFYSNEVSQYGYARLHGWQHIKKPIFNRLFSAVLVSGYFGPFFCESQVNRDLSNTEYPYVVAHELAHLAGVTSEAEASYWGFEYCRSSENSAERYSGYLEMLPYVLQQAHYLLPEENYNSFVDTICEKAKADYQTNRERWKERQIGWIEKIQRMMQDILLKGHGVSAGRKDYYGVVSMIITMDAAK